MKRVLVFILVILGILFLSSNQDQNKVAPSNSSINNGDSTYSPIESEPVEDSDLPATFGGYDCTVDCSGHEAGYDWAAEKGITSVDDCGGNSNSFIEGCQSYVEENYSDQYDDYYY